MDKKKKRKKKRIGHFIKGQQCTQTHAVLFFFGTTMVCVCVHLAWCISSHDTVMSSIQQVISLLS